MSTYFGENGRVCCATTSPCVDFFFMVTPSTSEQELLEYLSDAWEECPRTALQLIFNLGNVRQGGGGKQDRTNFFRALMWLWREHADAFLVNVEEIHAHGSLQCLVDVFMYIVHENIEILRSWTTCVDNPYRFATQLQMREKCRLRKSERLEESRESKELKLLRRRKEQQDRHARWQRFRSWMNVQGERCPDENAQAEASMEGSSDSAEYTCPPALQDTAFFAREYARSPALQNMTGLRVVREDIDHIEYRMQFDPLVITQWKDGLIAASYQRFLLSENALEAAAAKKHKRELAVSAQSAVAAALKKDADLEQLYVAVADIFATGLKGEVYHIVDVDSVLFDNCGKSLPPEKKLKKSASGLYAKWAPTPNQKHDKATGLVNIIIRRIFATWEPELIKKFFGKDLGIDTAGRVDDLLKPLFANNLRVDSTPANSEEDRRNLHLARCLRQRFHRDLIAPLRERAKVPETFIGRKAFHRVDYDRMPSMCRAVHGFRVFRKNDQKRYDAVLEKAAAQMYTKVTADPQNDKEVVKTGALLPHEIIKSAAKYSKGTDLASLVKSLGMFTVDQVRTALHISRGAMDEAADWLFSNMDHLDEAITAAAPSKQMKDQSTNLAHNIETECQWLGCVRRLYRERCVLADKYVSVLPVCDVSGSMSGTPMDVAVALSLLLAESANGDDPFRDSVVTFSATPQLVRVGEVVTSKEDAFPMELLGAWAGKEMDGVESAKKEHRLGSVAARANAVQGLDWGYNTNLTKTIQLVLKIAEERKLSDDFISNFYLVIFSDMQFDEACGMENVTAQEEIERRFRAAGYRSTPKIVYWNLRSCENALPVGQMDCKNVALLSGFSKGLLEKFMNIVGTKDSEGFEILRKWTDFNLEDDTSQASTKDTDCAEAMDPEQIMREVLAGDLYQRLRVSKRSSKRSFENI